MSFTIKSIFPSLNVPEDVLNKHRMAVGMRIRDSWNARYDYPPLKIDEDGQQVNQYEDTLLIGQKQLLKGILPKSPNPLKRRRGGEGKLPLRRTRTCSDLHPLLIIRLPKESQTGLPHSFDVVCVYGANFQFITPSKLLPG